MLNPVGADLDGRSALRRRLAELRQTAPRGYALTLIALIAILILYGSFLALDLYRLDLVRQLQTLGDIDPRDPLLADWRRRVQLMGRASTALKYLSLVLVSVLAFSLPTALGQLRRASLNRAAFAFTLAADFYILLIDRPVLGVLIFCCAQVTRLVLFGGRRRAILPLLLAALFGLIALQQSQLIQPLLSGRGQGPLIPELSAWFRAGEAGAEPPLFDSQSVLYGFSAAYLVLILAVSLYAWRTTAEIGRSSARYIPGRLERHVWRLGIMLFLACDLNVLFFNVLPAGHVLVRAASVLMWFFYLPSQLLLALAPTVLCAGEADRGSPAARERALEWRRAEREP